MRSSRLSAALGLALVAALVSTPAVASPDVPEPRDLAVVASEHDAAGRAGAATAEAARPELAAASTAPVAKRSITLRDKSLDAAPSSAQDVTRLTIVQDVSAKRITATATYAAKPTTSADSLFFAYLGFWDGTTCDAGADGFVVAGRAAGPEAYGAFVRTGTEVTTTRTTKDASVTVTAIGHSALGSRAFECGFGVVTPAGEGDPWTRFGADDLTVEHKKVPELEIHIYDELVALRSGKSAKVAIWVSNDGDATAKNVKVTLGGTGVALSSKTISFGTIASGDQKKKLVTVRLNGTKTRTVTAKASATGARTVKTTFKVAYIKKPVRLSSVTDRHYVLNSYKSGGATWDLTQVWFVDSRWAFIGKATKGEPTCSAKVKGCKRYTYDRRTGALTIGSSTAKVDNQRLVLNGKVYHATRLVPAGTKVGAKGYYVAAGSNCSGGITCTTTQKWVTLKKDGTYALTTTWMYSNNLSGAISSGTTKEKGSYRVLSKGRIKMAWKEGGSWKSRTQTFAVLPDERYATSVVTGGLLIGGDPFTGKYSML